MEALQLNELQQEVLTELLNVSVGKAENALSEMVPSEIGMSSNDRNFDGLSAHFQHNIYHSPKGQIRLKVLEADFSEQLPELLGSPQQILDAGSGLGQFALQLAKAGHQLTLSDISQEMIHEAEQRFSQESTTARFIHAPIQQLPEQLETTFPLILNHAVLEWCEDPFSVLEALLSLLAPGGTLSLMFYNIHGIRLRNLVRGNLRKVKSNRFQGDPGSLTPINPLEPSSVIRWLQQQGLTIRSHSGVRTFHDLMDAAPRNKIPLEDIIEQELALRYTPPYRDMGRYTHLICNKPTA